MKECCYRVKAEKTNDGIKIDAGGKKTLQKTFMSGTSLQPFEHGLCQQQTDYWCEGPVECRQPEHDEKTCPDIGCPHKRTVREVVDLGGNSPEVLKETKELEGKVVCGVDLKPCSYPDKKTLGCERGQVTAQPSSGS